MSDDNKQAGQLSTLFPMPIRLCLQDTDIEIKPFKFGELPRVFKALEPLSGAISAAIASPNAAEMLAMIIADGGDTLMDLMAIGAKQAREWVENLDMDEGIELIGTIFEVNRDFFVRKVLPILADKLPKVDMNLPTALSGQTS